MGSWEPAGLQAHPYKAFGHPPSPTSAAPPLPVTPVSQSKSPNPPQSMRPGPIWPSLSHPLLPSAYFLSSSWTLVCFKPARCSAAPGPLHWLVILPGMFFFSQTLTWLSLSSPSSPHLSYGLSEAYPDHLLHEATPPSLPSPSPLPCSVLSVSTASPPSNHHRTYLLA